jgi:anti-sigma factor RsiW
MSTTPHPRAELSAYLDDALTAPERSAVDSHLASCDDCRARLAELRSVASLIGALPDPVPSRRLVPRVAAAPSWLAPLRTLTTLASGISVFLFIASALLTNVNQLATTTSGQAAAPAAVAPAASGGTTPERGVAGTPTTSLNQPSTPAADSAKSAATPTAAPSSAGFSAAGPTAAPQDAATTTDQSTQRETIRTTTGFLGLSPLGWLAIALIFGAIAIALQRRLRSA